MPINVTTRFVPIPGIPPAATAAPSPLGRLAGLVGVWKGHGFNQIFRPFHKATDPGDDNFLELNLTNETLEFTEIPGEIPNRGFAQKDVSLFGMTYLQQIADKNVVDTAGRPAGIHIEPGIWINVPATTDPPEVASVARLANIPHGTALLAQGTPKSIGGAPTFAKVDITPFIIGQPSNKISFPSQKLANAPAALPGRRRSAPADIVGVTQAMVDDPNSVLRKALVGKTINSHTRIHVTTHMTATTTPDTGSGIADIAFLDGNGSPNAQVTLMDSTFWLSHFTDASGSGTLLQYSQVVLLDFAPLSWPHVSVANLIKQPTTTSATRELLVARELDVSSTGDGPGSADPGRAGPAEPAPAAGRLVVIPDDDDDDLDAPPAGAAPTKKVARATRKAPAKGRPPTR
jgi:hypothetical protein